ncbi:MAG: hypothetical protein ABIE14_02750 [Patescibacteria group bacterium]
MKINDAFKIAIIATAFLVAFSVVYYFVIFLPNSNQSANTVSNTLKCNKLYELKKSKYWEDEIGQSKAIYNSNLNTCLALNIYNNSDTKKYFAMVMDMSDDSTLMYYSSTPKGFYFEGEDYKKITCKENYIYFELVQNGKTVKEYGCDLDDEGQLTDKFGLFDKIFEQVRSYGFKVFGGFENK